ncbi:MAG: hypothetical protein V4623_06240, partial [Pseudomonadota bacterium]
SRSSGLSLWRATVVHRSFRVQLPPTEHWKLLDVSSVYEPDIPTIAFVQLDRSDPNLIRSFFRASVLSLDKVEPLGEGADTCLAFISRHFTPLPGTVRRYAT